jgi:hypothetical protein
VRTPAEENIIGRDLARNGSQGLLKFERIGKDLKVSQLSMVGEQISKPGEQCRVDVIGGAPLGTKFIGRPEGLARYDLEIAACPISFEVLDGAVFVQHTVCAFTAADCRVDPAGVWGPQGNTISAERAKEMEKARPRAEADMRANFRALLANAGKDRAAIKSIAGEQAGFSSEREMICRDYARESVHGFCALRMTEARAIALSKKLLGDKVESVVPKKKPRPKPPATLAAPAGEAPPPIQ